MDFAIPFIMIATVFSSVIIVKRNIWGSSRFWTILLVMAIVHLLILLYFPWPTGWTPAFVSALVAVIDLYLLLFAINVMVRNISD